MVKCLDGYDGCFCVEIKDVLRLVADFFVDLFILRETKTENPTLGTAAGNLWSLNR